MAGGTLKMGVTDAQAMVGAGDIRSPVALGTTQRLTQDGDNVSAVLGGDAAGEEPAKDRIGEDPPVQALDGGGNGGPAADRLINVDRCRLGGRDGI